MAHLISVIVCEEYQELISGDCNYIAVFDDIFEVGLCEFDLVLKWYGDDEIILEKIVVMSPSDHVICASEQEVKVNGIQDTLSEMEVEFK